MNLGGHVPPVPSAICAPAPVPKGAEVDTPATSRCFAADATTSGGSAVVAKGASMDRESSETALVAVTEASRNRESPWWEHR